MQIYDIAPPERQEYNRGKRGEAADGGKYKSRSQRDLTITEKETCASAERHAPNSKTSLRGALPDRVLFRARNTKFPDRHPLFTPSEVGPGDIAISE